MNREAAVHQTHGDAPEHWDPDIRIEKVTSVLPIVEDVSYAPAVATQHGSSAILAEDVSEVVIPFLRMESPVPTMCDPQEGRISNFTTGEHVHVWCNRCVNFLNPGAATHNSCPDCRILRTIMQLSQRWFDFMWDYRMDMETMESFSATRAVLQSMATIMDA